MVLGSPIDGARLTLDSAISFLGRRTAQCLAIGMAWPAAWPARYGTLGTAQANEDAKIAATAKKQADAADAAKAKEAQLHAGIAELLKEARPLLARTQDPASHGGLSQLASRYA